MAFPENWHQEDRIFTPGLRDIYPIGERLGDDETWSIFNYFDTKKEIHALIYLKYIEENFDSDIWFFPSLFPYELISLNCLKSNPKIVGISRSEEHTSELQSH